jgi:hypothetical protein
MARKPAAESSILASSLHLVITHTVRVLRYDSVYGGLEGTSGERTRLIRVVAYGGIQQVAACVRALRVLGGEIRARPGIGMLTCAGSLRIVTITVKQHERCLSLMAVFWG